jgi:hypothetical protein
MPFRILPFISCSWGPPDDGRSMEGPAYLIKKAVVNGIQKGKGSKGLSLSFASGNGAGSGDQCNFDGYTNSIYSVTVSAVDYKGLHPYYSESCAANLVVAYSSGSGNHIVSCCCIASNSPPTPTYLDYDRCRQRQMCNDARWNICCSSERCRCLCSCSSGTVCHI